MRVSVTFDIPNEEVCGLLESAGELRFLDGTIRAGAPLPDAIRRAVARLIRGGPPLPTRVFRNVHETDVKTERLFVVINPEEGEIVDEVLAKDGVPLVLTRYSAKYEAHRARGCRKQICKIGELARWAGVKR